MSFLKITYAKRRRRRRAAKSLGILPILGFVLLASSLRWQLQSASLVSYDISYSSNKMEIDSALPSVKVVFSHHHHQQQQGQEEEQFYQTSSCSCYNINATFSCCQRMFRKTHKMGFEIVSNIYNSFVKSNNWRQKRIKQIQGFRSWQHPQTTTKWTSPELVLQGRPMDYRDVVVTRNIYQSIASGYMYHKQGHECWLDAFGKPWKRHVRTLWQWQDYLYNNSLDTRRNNNKVPRFYLENKLLGPVMKPGAKIEKQNPGFQANNSFCHFLANEPITLGLEVYMEWAFAVYYQAVWDHYQMANNNNNNTVSYNHHVGKTLYICFEHLTKDPIVAKQTIEQALDWWFPRLDKSSSKGTPQAFLLANYTGWLPNGQKVYKGGHATSHDPTTRKQLQELIRKLDESTFGGKVASFHQALPCDG